MRATLILALVLAVAGPAAAQERAADVEPILEENALLLAIRLPELMQRARAAGALDRTVQDMLEELRRRGLPAGEAAVVLEPEVEAVERGGPPDNFGAFVRTQLDQGVRGRELAERIRGEHARRGIGRPEGAGRPESAGRPEGAGRPQGAGRPTPATPPRDTVRPEPGRRP